MNTRRSVVGLMGLLVVLALIVPTVGADHNREVARTWNDVGLNSRLGQADVLVWNDAGFHTTLGHTNAWTWNDATLQQPWAAQVKTVGWKDVAFQTGVTLDNTVGWSDTGTTAGRQWFYSAAKG